MDFVFEQLRLGGDRNLGYLLGDRHAGVCVLIDPAFDPAMAVDRAEAQLLKVSHIVNTHGHADHINGNAKAQELTGAPVAGFAESKEIKLDVPLKDGAFLAVGRFALRVLHTPGHCDDHLVIALDDPPVAITGDLLFVGKVGGTGSVAATRTEWQSLQRVLRELPDETTIWPGHDYGCRPCSTIGLEKRTNPFLLCKNVDEFICFKGAWSGYKAQLGLK